MSEDRKSLKDQGKQTIIITESAGAVIEGISCKEPWFKASHKPLLKKQWLDFVLKNV